MMAYAHSLLTGVVLIDLIKTQIDSNPAIRRRLVFDLNLALGNLVALVRQEAAVYTH
jgi:hypothetical protein